MQAWQDTMMEKEEKNGAPNSFSLSFKLLLVLTLKLHKPCNNNNNNQVLS